MTWRRSATNSSCWGRPAPCSPGTPTPPFPLPGHRVPASPSEELSGSSSTADTAAGPALLAGAATVPVTTDFTSPSSPRRPDLEAMLPPLGHAHCVPLSLRGRFSAYCKGRPDRLRPPVSPPRSGHPGRGAAQAARADPVEPSRPELAGQRGLAMTLLRAQHPRSQGHSSAPCRTGASNPEKYSEQRPLPDAPDQPLLTAAPGPASSPIGGDPVTSVT